MTTPFVLLICTVIAQFYSDNNLVIEKKCPFDIVGVWKTEITNAPVYFNFQTEGWVKIIGKVDHSIESLPQDFDIIAEMNYQLDNSAAPTQVEFVANSRSEFFPVGISGFEISEYNNSKFVTVNPINGTKMNWVRVQAHRYFLTFATRADNDLEGFAAVSVLNGRSIDSEAFGYHHNNTPSFGRVPDNFYKDFIYKDSPSHILFCIELTEPEFHRINTLFEDWDQKSRSKMLPYNNSKANALVFINDVTGNINACNSKLKLRKSYSDVIEFIKMLKKDNSALHITDQIFPKNWKPKL